MSASSKVYRAIHTSNFELLCENISSVEIITGHITDALSYGCPHNIIELLTDHIDLKNILPLLYEKAIYHNNEFVCNWLVSKHIPFNRMSCFLAVRTSIKWVKWLIQNKCPIQYFMNMGICSDVSVETVQYLKTFDITFNLNNLNWINKLELLKCIKELYGIQFNKINLSQTSSLLEIFRWWIDNGVPITNDNITYMVVNEYLYREKVEILHRRGFKVNSNLLGYIIMRYDDDVAESVLEYLNEYENIDNKQIWTYLLNNCTVENDREHQSLLKIYNLFPYNGKIVVTSICNYLEYIENEWLKNHNIIVVEWE